MSLNYLTGGKTAKFINFTGGTVNADTSTVTDAIVETSLKLDGADILDSNDNELLTHTAAPAAVNHVELINAATGGAPGLKTSGDDASIDMLLEPKGAGEINLHRPKLVTALNMAGQDLVDENGDELLALTASAAPVNYVEIKSADAAAPVVIEAKGEDAAVPIKLLPKGGSVVDVSSSRITSLANSVDPQDAVTQAEITAAGYMQDLIDDTTPQLGGALDLNGNLNLFEGTDEVLDFVAVSSAVNQLSISNSATGQPVGIGATGDDADISFAIGAKGVGTVNFLSGTNMGGSVIANVADPVAVTDAANRQWVLANSINALSEDATPTLAAALDAGGFAITNGVAAALGTDYAILNDVQGQGYITSVVEDITPVLGGTLDAGGFQVQNLAAGTLDGDAVRKDYVDVRSAFSGASADGQAGTGAVAPAVLSLLGESGSSVAFQAVSDDFLVNDSGLYCVTYHAQLTGTANDDITISLGTGDGTTAIPGTASKATLQATGDFVSMSRTMMLDLTAPYTLELLFTGAATTTLTATETAIQVRRID